MICPQCQSPMTRITMGSAIVGETLPSCSRCRGQRASASAKKGGNPKQARRERIMRERRREAMGL